nr:MFS transporter [uncultured Albidiferax sp.]
MTAASAGEFRTGWPTLLLAMVGVATSVSALLIYSLGTLVVPLEQALHWSRADLQIAVSFLAAGGAISVNLVGWLNQRFGMRFVSGVSMLAVVLAFASLTQMQGSIGWMYLGYFVLPFIGLGTTPVTWTHIVALHFQKHRGLALSIVLCGTGFTAALLPSALAWAMARWGWQAGYLTLAALPLLLWLSMAWRRLPARAVATGLPTPLAAAAVTGMPFAQALRDRRFWVCNIGLGLVVSAIYGMATNTVPLLRDIGLTAAEAGGVFGVFGVALIVGRIGVGTLIDRLWAPGVAAIALALPAIGCLLFLAADASTPVALLLVATALVGVGSGAEFDIAAYLVSRYFGLRDYGRLFGLHLCVVTLGSTVAPFVFAGLLRSTGGYSAMLLVCAACCVVGPLLLLTLGRYPAKS